jgi:hypothetical protein
MRRRRSRERPTRRPHADADPQDARYELPDNGAEWNQTVVDVHGGLGLVDAAAAHDGKYQLHERADDEANQWHHDQQAQRGRRKR